MNLRTKKALAVLLRGAISLAFWTFYGLSRGRHLGVNPVFFAFVAFFLAIAGYTWWLYGDSPKAVALRARSEARKVARRERTWRI